MNGNVQTLNTDSLEYVRYLPDNCFDLLVADPPYGIGMSKPAGKSQEYSKKELKDHKWDDEAPSAEFFKELFRVSKNQIVFGANHFIDRIPEPRNSSCWIVWDKRENIIPERTYADCELAWTSFKSPTRVFRFFWDGFLQRQNEIRIHPTQKPVSLYEWIFMRYAKEGFRILDPFGGSFSSAVAAHRLDMNLELTIIEKNEEIFETGRRRYVDDTSQQRLF